jgi:hypothetical protein
MFGRGRKDNEDPFAALKNGGTYQSTPSTLPDLGLGGDAPSVSPSVSPSPAQPMATSQQPARSMTASPVNYSSPPASPTTPRSRRITRATGGYSPGARAGWRLGTIVFVLIVVGAVVGSVHHTVNEVKIPSFTFNTGGVTTPGSGNGTTSPATVAPRPVSYLTAHGLRAGLAEVKRLSHGAKEVTLLRLDGRSLITYATRPNGSESQIDISPGGTFVSSANDSGERPVPVSKIKPNVLGALMTQMHRRYHVPLSRIDYAVVSSPAGEAPSWLVFVKNASHQAYAAPLEGGTLKPI